jgi:hypothetical protein
MRMRVLAARRTKTSISEKQYEKITVAMALKPVRLSLRIYSNNCIKVHGWPFARS